MVSTLEQQIDRLSQQVPDLPAIAKDIPSGQSQYIGPARTVLYMFEMSMVRNIEYSEGDRTVIVHIDPVFFSLDYGLGSQSE